VRSREVAGQNPRFDWTAQLKVSAERKNLVLKMLHRDEFGAHKPLCFVSVPLPAQHAEPVDFELVDLSSCPRTSAAFVKMSVESWPESRPPSVSVGNASSRPLSASSFRSSLLNRLPSPTTTRESKAEIAERLRRNLEDLENLMQRLPRGH